MGCFNSIVIDAPIDQVWATIRDFHDLSWGAGVIETCERVGAAAGDQIGARRVLNGAFHETLVAIDDRARSFRYTIDDGPGPVAADAVTDYVGSLALTEITEGDRTLAVWSSTWGTSEGGVAEFCNPVYRAALAAMKAHFVKAR